MWLACSIELELGTAYAIDHFLSSRAGEDPVLRCRDGRADSVVAVFGDRSPVSPLVAAVGTAIRCCGDLTPVVKHLARSPLVLGSGLT